MAKASEKPKARDLSDVCRLIRTPDGEIRAECTDAEAARQLIDAAIRGKFTVAFVPKTKDLETPRKPGKPK